MTLCTASLIETHRAELAEWAGRLSRPITLMEVCGTHTMAIYRHGVLPLLPDNVKLVSGPGCPVCVTAQGQIDQVIELSRRRDVTIATFGDMVRVPGTVSSLERERSLGADVRVVYSPADAVTIAESTPDRQVMLVGIGFETTAPTIAAALIDARRRGLKNFTVLAAAKHLMPALLALLDSGNLKIDGLICPGHASVILGSDCYKPLARDYGIPCAVTGFEPDEMLRGITSLTRMNAQGKPDVENQYSVWVKPEGNVKALAMIDEVFDYGDVAWRGLGVIPGSGMVLREDWSEFDAVKRFNLQEIDAPEPAGCRCGDVLRGALRPQDCPLFGKHCTTEHPVGPCMVSTEGCCAAAYRYGRAH